MKFMETKISFDNDTFAGELTPLMCPNFISEISATFQKAQMANRCSWFFRVDRDQASVSIPWRSCTRQDGLFLTPLRKLTATMMHAKNFTSGQSKKEQYFKGMLICADFPGT